MGRLSIGRMLLNFAEDVIQYARMGAPHVSEDSYENRLAECEACPHLEEYRCGMCGCVVEEKAKWATAECPDNRWADEGEDNDTETSE